MFPRRFRLKRCSLFTKTLASGKTLCKMPGLLLLGLPRSFPSEHPTQFGIVVSKKVSNRANVRNKVKRRLREIIRTEVLPQFRPKLDPYIALVFIARKPILEVSYREIQDQLRACLQKCK